MQSKTFSGVSRPLATVMVLKNPFSRPHTLKVLWKYFLKVIGINTEIILEAKRDDCKSDILPQVYSWSVAHWKSRCSYMQIFAAGKKTAKSPAYQAVGL